MNKIAIFADVQNIYYTVKQRYNRYFDYSILWQKISDQGNIVKAYAYAIDRQDKKQLQFQQSLTELGFEIKLKPYIQRRDGTAKGDWDVGITIDILETAPSVDTIILLSGDGDFDLLAQKITQKYEVNFIVYSVKDLTAASLIHAASQHIPIDEQFLIHN